ncbi:MAG: Bax inhibitor-1/YccA family protein [Filimonas sp.]|nr:Bax inhibitor-1/YccA family protein [Filimonas sp.]
MALFESGNPTLSEKIFNRSLENADSGVMTVRGTMAKFGFLLLMVIAGAAYTWSLYSQSILSQDISKVMTFLWIGVIGGLITAVIISFKPTAARYLAPVYGLLEGFVLGALSAILNDAFAKTYPGIILQAVGLTLAVALGMFLLYNFRIIKPTQRFKSIIISATMGVFLFYMIAMVLRLFHVDLPFMYNSSALGIGISLVIVAIAALNLILDFDRIEQGAEMGAPKHMEWYCAFGLLVTIVWLYIEILKLLSRFANNKN